MPSLHRTAGRQHEPSAPHTTPTRLPALSAESRATHAVTPLTATTASFSTIHATQQLGFLGTQPQCRSVFLRFGRPVDEGVVVDRGFMAGQGLQPVGSRLDGVVAEPVRPTCSRPPRARRGTYRSEPDVRRTAAAPRPGRSCGKSRTRVNLGHARSDSAVVGHCRDRTERRWSSNWSRSGRVVPPEHGRRGRYGSHVLQNTVLRGPPLLAHSGCDLLSASSQEEARRGLLLALAAAHVVDYDGCDAAWQADAIASFTVQTAQA